MEHSKLFDTRQDQLVDASSLSSQRFDRFMAVISAVLVQVPGIYKIRYIGQTTLSSAAVSVHTNWHRLLLGLQTPWILCICLIFVWTLCRSLACSLEQGRYSSVAEAIDSMHADTSRG